MNKKEKYKNVIARTQRCFYSPELGGIARTFGGFECAILEVGVNFEIMSKFRPENRKYYYNGITGYIGAGNNPLVFTKRPKASFSKIKQLYGEHLEKIKPSEKSFHTEKVLSPDLKIKIKEEIRKDTIRIIRARILTLLISLILFAILTIGAIKLLYLLIPSLNG